VLEKRRDVKREETGKGERGSNVHLGNIRSKWKALKKPYF
jgi:hypothetical protein